MFERLREDVKSVFHRDPAARNTFEVLTNYPGLHALLFHHDTELESCQVVNFGDALRLRWFEQTKPDIYIKMLR